MQKQVLIVGASSAIAIALAHCYLQQGIAVVTVSRQEWNTAIKPTPSAHVRVSDYQESSIEQAIATIGSYNQNPFTHVYICNGILHSESIQPEKRLEDISAEAFMQTVMANTLTPLLWLQKLTPLLTASAHNRVNCGHPQADPSRPKKAPCKIVVFSARVGSISDNKLGGWYSYRASKSALNMLVKTAAIELARRAKHIKIMAFHPGTTDTALSKPFQKNVPKHKLFSAEFVAKALIDIVENLAVDGQASYLDWQGKTITW